MPKQLKDYFFSSPKKFFSDNRVDLCRVVSGCGSGASVLTQVYTTDSPTVTWTGTGTQADHLVATANTIYAADGTLSADRTITGNSHTLAFSGVDNFTVNANLDILLSNGINILIFDSGGGHLSGNTSFGSVFTPTAKIHVAAGSTAASTAPIKLTAGTTMNVIEQGAIEYDGTSLLFTRTAASREYVVTMVPVAGAAPATTAGNAFTDYYGANITNVLGTPNRWADVHVGGVLYKMPLYLP